MIETIETTAPAAPVVMNIPRRSLPTATATETAALIGMIERAAMDPNYDLDRLERMYAMYENAAARSAKSAFLDALMTAKTQFPTLIKTGTITGNIEEGGKVVGKQEQSKYAKWEEVCGQIEPVLARHSLVLTFTTEQSSLDRVSVTAILTHREGHSERAQMSLGIDATGGKNNAQGWGSSISYGKRYTTFAILNLVGHDDKDTDGEPPAPDTVSEEQQIAIREALEGKNIPAKDFCERYEVESIAALPSSRFDAAMAAIKKASRRD